MKSYVVVQYNACPGEFEFVAAETPIAAGIPL